MSRVGRMPVKVPEKVKVSTRGKDASERQIHDIIDVNFPSKRLLVGETFNAPGKWSSYPPHKHDRNAPPDETLLRRLFGLRVIVGGGAKVSFIPVFGSVE